MMSLQRPTLINSLNGFSGNILYFYFQKWLQNFSPNKAENLKQKQNRARDLSAGAKDNYKSDRLANFRYRPLHNELEELNSVDRVTIRTKKKKKNTVLRYVIEPPYFFLRKSRD